MANVPAPVIGGSRVYCPFQDSEPVSGGVRWWTCGWRRRLRSRGLAKFRHHWRKHHG